MTEQDPFQVGMPSPVVEPEVSAIQRMKKHRRRGIGSGGISLNLTAMIDVVFLLLIYFMVATNFKVGEEIYRLDLPDRNQAFEELDPFELDEEPLRISVSSSPFGRLNYRLAIEGPYPQPDDFEELFRFLAERQINEFTSGGLFESDHPIIIAPTITTRWEHAMEVFNCAARAHYTNVIFAKPG